MASEFPTSGYIVIEATNTDTASLQYGKITVKQFNILAEAH